MKTLACVSALTKAEDSAQLLTEASGKLNEAYPQSMRESEASCSEKLWERRASMRSNAYPTYW